MACERATASLAGLASTSGRQQLQPQQRQPRRLAAAPRLARTVRRQLGAAVRAAAGSAVPGRPWISIPWLNIGREAFEELQMEMGFCSIRQQYSPELVRERAIGSLPALLALAGRGMQIGWEVGLFLAGLWFDSLQGAAEDSLRVKYRATQLRDLLTRLGPTFIKAGQVLANRPDIVREDYMNELCVLQDDVPPFPDEQAFALIESSLGRPLGEVFSSISERPVAAASLGQVYKAVLRETGENVAVKVQRPGVEPLIFRDIFLFRTLGTFVNAWSLQRLGCNAELIVDEFGEKLLEELDYVQEARNILDFYANFENDPSVKIPWVRRDLSGPKVLVMEWIDGIRCTDVEGIKASGIDLPGFIRTGVVSGLRQLLEFGLFHGDPHPGNIFALQDGRIAYVDFGNVAELSQRNKEILIDAVVHAVNKDYPGMAEDFIKLGFLAKGTNVDPLVPALEKIWADSMGQSLADFNFRTVTSKFNELVYQYPIRIPERYSLVIRSLLTQEGICLTLDPAFHFLEVAYPYVARRLLTDEDPALRTRLFQVLFQDGRFQWDRLENLLQLAKEGSGGTGPGATGGLDLSTTVSDGARVVLLDDELRRQLLRAFTEDDRLHVDEVARLLRLVQGDINVPRVVQSTVTQLPTLARQLALGWSDHASEELGRTADLTITVEGAQLKLHSAVAAAGSRVLRTALCSCGSGGGSAAAAAVQAAFEGCTLEDVQLFLGLLYNPVGLESGDVDTATVDKPDSWHGLLSLADKLDAAAVLQACDIHIARRLSEILVLRESQPLTFSPVDWLAWLLLADKLCLSRVAACCAAPLAKEMITGPAKQRVAQLAQLGQPAAQVMIAVLLMGAKNCGNASNAARAVPSNVDWKAPENLFNG
ncbi:putative aarF domain-containing kinase chloroplastic isoform A [Chlorella sorokiniana]|uniref:AarF domain-containing kinase chloroplastic isoform A n=1 Tax=Chlorella sorokiniana TaxID=3076 RepID=A0A2P6TF68_CHLSO|nr:putative aarF domain-containing kinase chloroplastic isoform A [Chlorella sorokiniana]|eukprot:PRW32613.1 putative aarF domain-containing kinase chloroplastic isoform A [Chlorella sorokiniana]